MKKLLVFLTAFTMMSSMFSCSEKKEESSGSDSKVEESSVIQPVTHEYDKTVDKSVFVGKWECCRMVAGGQERTDYRGIPAYALFQYDLHEDNTASLPDSVIEVSDPNNPITYTWGAISDKEVEIVGSNGAVLIYTLNDDGNLEDIENGEEVVLEKVDEFQYFDFKNYYEELANQFVLTPVETDADGNVIDKGEPVTMGID
ncbi:MAG: hypothetical protein K2G36_04450 [Ruminococcus sp.]|nr:hypothetical protein [Ruminococcus sp.]